MAPRSRSTRTGHTGHADRSLYSAHLGVSLHALSLLKCAHISHPGGIARGYDAAIRSRSRMAGVYPRRLNSWLLKALTFGAHLSAAGTPGVSSPAAADGTDEPACWPDPEPAWPTGSTVGAEALRDEEILAAADKGGARVIKHEIAGPAFSLSLTPIHSLRHRLVRSRQSASQDVAGFLIF